MFGFIDKNSLRLSTFFKKKIVDLPLPNSKRVLQLYSSNNEINFFHCRIFNFEGFDSLEKKIFIYFKGLKK